MRHRHDEYASDRLNPRRRSSDLDLLLSQFASPIILILLAAAGLSFFLADRTDTAIGDTDRRDGPAAQSERVLLPRLLNAVFEKVFYHRVAP